jgi:antirestriction protein ArdC
MKQNAQAKTSEKKDTASKVVERLLELTKSGSLPWESPWIRLQPKNPLSGTKYKGINWLLLTVAMRDTDGDNRFVTYKQVQKYAETTGRSVHVRAGSKGHMIVKYGTFAKEREKADGTMVIGQIPFLVAHTVFSITQIEGYNEPNPDLGKKIATMPEVEAILDRFNIKTVWDNQAAYSPSLDCLYMPNRDAFESVEAYIKVKLHEMIHYTGHKDRLNRKSMEEGKDQKYSTEELVAEIGACIAMAELGIEYKVEESADYIKGWWKVIKHNPKNFVWAVSQAQKAVEYILGTKQEEVEISEEAFATA